MAALVVVLHHVAAFFLYAYPLTALAVPLWAIHRYGHPAVVIFFVLSGFVLMSSTIGRPEVSFKSFVTRRVFRIYPAFYVTLAVAATAAVAIEVRPFAELGGYWNGAIPEFVWLDLLRASTLLLWIGNLTVLPIVWSLIHEMRFSLLFPMLARIAKQQRMAFAALTFTGLLASFGVQVIMGGGHLFLGTDLLTSLAITAFYLPMFAVGMLAAFYYDRRVAFSPGWKLELVIILAAAILLYLDVDAVSACASVALIILLVCRNWLSRLFSTAPLVWLGRVSYSLYLVHFPILFYAAWLFRGKTEAQFALGLALAVIVSFVAAWFLSEFVEHKAKNLGRRTSTISA
ncbi:acyltransferase [Sphingomonas prati]|nr:acyltransferase [Sphingomonas prati]